MNYKIHVYTLDTITSPFKDPIKTLASVNATRTGGGAESVKYQTSMHIHDEQII